MASETTYPKVGQRGTGRRKEAIARVRLIAGAPDIIINGQSLDLYMGNRPLAHKRIQEPLKRLDLSEQYKILAKVEGGGKVGQADAIRMGVARALAELNPEYHLVMRSEGFLTRDARVKERKKYGRKKARKRFQFSKR